MVWYGVVRCGMVRYGRPDMRIKTKPVPSCPECGCRMILRRPRFAVDKWDPFWGCSMYPECKGSRNIDPFSGEPEDDDEWLLD